LILPLVAGLLPVLVGALPSRAAVIAPPLASALESADPADERPVIVRLADRVDPRRFRDGERRRRRQRLVTALHGKAALTHAPVRALLRRHGARRVVPLWITNGLAFRATPDGIRALAALPGVERLTLDATLEAPGVTAVPPAPQWNVAAVGAPVLWDLGYTGAGVVVASMDTGVDVGHSDLGPRWRGGANSWFDPNGAHPTPADASGHGTWTMGVMVGGAAGGTTIGVAPDARWIAVKIFDDAGRASLSAIHAGFQWLLDPDGNPATDDAPDVVNNSWGLTDRVGLCEQEFEPDVAVLTAAGIGVVFSAGNTGPGAGSSVSPANHAKSLAVGAVDAAGVVAGFSSRGPSACDGAIFPDLVAPGVAIRTADLTFGGVFPDSYISVSGTSLAAPHVAGGLALLMQALPDRSLAELEAAVLGTATDVGSLGPDNAAGHGLLDLAAAWTWLTAATTGSVDVRVGAGPDDAEERPSGSVSLSSSDLELVRDRDDQTVGMRFAGVEVPARATITSAWIELQVDEATSEPTSLTIAGQATGNAPPFGTTARDVSGRARTAARVEWRDVPPWTTVGDRHRSPDVADVVQEIVDRDDWAPGNALALIVTGTGRRVAEAWDGDRAGAPLLHVDWAMPARLPTTTTSTTTTITTIPSSTTTTTSTTSTTSSLVPESTATTSTSSTTSTLATGTRTLSSPVVAGNDDAEERPSGSVNLSSSDLELVRDLDNQTVGIRFLGVAIPPDATIDRAWVQFQVDEAMADAASLVVTGQDAGDAPAFRARARDVSSRPRTVAVPWPDVPPWPTVGAREAAQRTPDLSGILRQIVARQDWRSGNAVVLIVEGAGKRVAEAYDGDPGGAPTLHVEFRAAANGPPAASTTTTTSMPSAPSSTTSTLGQVSVTTTSIVPPAPQTLAVRVAAGDDDAEERASGAVSLGSSDLELVRDRDQERVGLRFRSVALPAGARIARAWVQFQVDEATSETTSLLVTGEDTGNAPAFSASAGNVSARARTVAVPWPDVPPWPTVGEQGPAQRTPDLAPILRQIVERGDWRSGNAVVLVVEGAGRRVAESWDGDAAGAPALHVEYREP
jgi:bacillopeptidase F